MRLGKFYNRHVSICLEDDKYPARCRKLGRAWLIRVWRIKLVFTTRSINKREERNLINFVVLLKEIQDENSIL